MFCIQCGKEQSNESIFCSNCGKEIKASFFNSSVNNSVQDVVKDNAAVNFLKKQVNKEKEAAGRIWKVYLKILIVFWGLMGISFLFSSAWPIGIIFILVAIYVWKRTAPKSIED